MSTYLPMIKKLTFLKSLKGEWYIDLPEYIEMGGNMADLQMVLGADDLLEKLAEEKREIILLISTDVKEIRDYEELPMFAKHNWDWLSKAAYIPSASGMYYTNGAMYLWLCPVTEFVFGEYPPNIYYKIFRDETKKVQEQEDGPGF